jgi:hypothetical protein
LNTKRKKGRALLAVALAATTVGAFALTSGTASAAVGDNVIQNGDFSVSGADGSLVGATTDFALAALGVQGNHYANPGDPLTSWDEGTYVVATNPFDQHVLWVNQPSDNPKMIVNGFTTSDNQVVWSQSNPGIVCAVGDQVRYDFSATVANILPLAAISDGGAAISVEINGVDVADVNLTSNDPSNPVVLTGNTVPAADPVVLTIRNGSTVKVGNDFSLDDISLIQTTGCLSPVTPAFLAATPATCAAAGGLVGNPVFPLDNGSYTLSIDPAFTGAGTYTLTATPDAGFGFPAGTVTTAQVTVDPLGFGLNCAPAVGGKTIGFWTNKNGAPIAQTLWASAIAPYGNAIGNLTYAQGQTALKASSSTNLGKDMLRAQFIGTALNVKYIAGYGDQKVNVPATSAIDGGTTVTVKQYLADINAGWASLNTKASITSVEVVLDSINQDVASILFV